MDIKLSCRYKHSISQAPKILDLHYLTLFYQQILYSTLIWQEVNLIVSEQFINLRDLNLVGIKFCVDLILAI